MSSPHAGRRVRTPVLVLLIGMLTTALITTQVSRSAATTDRERFNVAVDRVQDSINDRIGLYIAMLRAGAGLFAAADVRTPEQFRAFVERLELPLRYPGVQGIGFSARIPDSELAQVVTDERRLGRPAFHVWPDGSRSEYHTILYLEPLDRRNQSAIGYDMFTEPTRRATMERARDSGEPAASGLVTLVQEIDEVKQPGFLIYLPVYDGGATPVTVEDRRRRLRGFIYSAFRAGDLFSGILGSNPRPRAALALYDGPPAPETLIHRTAVDDLTGRFRTSRSLQVGGRSWTAEMLSTAAIDRGSSKHLVPLVGWCGAGITLLLSGLTLLEARARARAEGSEGAARDASNQFEQLANAIPQLAWMASPDGWIYWYNDRWYEYTGTTAEQMRGWGWRQVHSPQELPDVEARWQHSLSSGEPFEMEFPLRAADGTYRLFLTRVVPVRDATGSIVRWFGTNTDVHYRREAERALREQTATLESLNRTGAQLGGELNLERLVQAVTDAATKLTRAEFGAFFYNTVNAQGGSYTLYALSGVPHAAFEHFAMPRTTALFAPTFGGEGPIRSADITVDPRYGHNAPHRGMPPGHLPVRSYLAAPVKSRSGEVLGGLFFGHSEPDAFTEQAEQIVVGIAGQAGIAIDNARLYGQVEQLLVSERSARSEAERVSRLKDEFLATLSHELRTPLNAVIGWAHMLSAGAMSAGKQQQAIETILRNARIQLQLVEELLDMSRIISGRVRIVAAPVDLLDVVTAALDVVRPAATAKNIALQVDTGAGPHVVEGDADRLQQIVWNLLANAVKFTPAGGSVTVRLSTFETDARIEVTDTGIGISPDFLPHVFERFRQADGSITRGYGGLGLGLSIVRSLVEMHGGTIHAASGGADQGATFTVVLPTQGMAAASLPTRLAAERGVAAESLALQGLSILVVDDDADAGDLVREILTQHGAEVTLAGSGAVALQRLQLDGARFDLIVSDLGMPELDGYEFLRQVRAFPAERGSRAPALALTAYAGADDRARALAAGYDRHLAKPVTPSALVATCAALARAVAQDG